MSTVLIVESYPNLANLYRDVLTEAGYNVLVASNSKEANDLSMSQAIDLAVIDEGLRGGDEKELIENPVFLDRVHPKDLSGSMRRGVFQDT
jgi:DNA-binding response OmpR family regulator